MAFAGGIYPFLPALIIFRNDYTVIITKNGYDLWTRNLKAYYNSSTREDADLFLEKFKKDLLGEHTDKLTVSIEWLADDLIKLKNEQECEADFTLTYETTLSISLKSYEEKQLFKKAVI